MKKKKDKLKCYVLPIAMILAAFAVVFFIADQLSITGLTVAIDSMDEYDMQGNYSLGGNCGVDIECVTVGCYCIHSDEAEDITPRCDLNLPTPEEQGYFCGCYRNECIWYK